MEETVQVEWIDGPNKGKFEHLKRVFGGFQRTERDESLTYVPGNSPVRVCRPFELTPLMIS